jgi:hypothetical protein
MPIGRYLVALAAFLLAIPAAHAQTPAQANVVASCGTPNSTYTAGKNAPVTQNTTGTLCTASSGGGGGTSSNFGAAFPAAGTAIGVKNGANMVNLVADANSSLQVVQWQGAGALSATNGTFANLLQGNVALSATNGLFTNLLQGNAVVSAGNPIFASITNSIGITGTFSNASSAVATTSTNLPTVAYSYGFNGTTWDQLQVDANKNLKEVIFQGASALSATNGLFSNILQNNAVLSATNGIFNNQVIAGAVLSATNGSYANLLQGNAVLSATNGIFNNQVIAGAVLSATNGSYANLLQGNAVISATNGIYANLLQGNAVLSSANPAFVTIVPTTAGGLSIVSNIVANNTTSVAVKASAGQLYGIDAYSISAATPAFIKLYNAAQGSTTCGSGTPFARFMIPSPGATGGGQIWHDLNGLAFGTAITYCVTTGIGDADATAPAASTYIVNFQYK